MSLKTKIVIIGAGISGLTIGYELSKKFGEDVSIIESQDYVGGLAATLKNNGIIYDLGSHRIHTDTSKEIIEYIEEIIQQPLLKRPRNGRLYFQGKFIEYPPNMLSVLRDFSIKKIAYYGLSYMNGFLSSSFNEEENFETIMKKRVGKNMYNSFYKDYAEKLWGLPPKEMSVDVGKRGRFLGGFEIIKKLLFRNKKFFYYPQEGIGQICRELSKKIMTNKGKIIKNSRVNQITSKKDGYKLEYLGKNGEKEEIETEIVISTIPIDSLYNLLGNKDESKKLQWRGMRILFLILDGKIDKVHDTYYFPNTDILFGRVSLINRFSPKLNNKLRQNLLTVEVPCSKNDEVWDIPEHELVKMCLSQLEETGVIENPSLKDFFSIKEESVYPIYINGWREKFTEIYEDISKRKNLYTIGRNGLFLHCNLDHGILQGIELADFIKNGGKNPDIWREKSSKFLKFCARE